MSRWFVILLIILSFCSYGAEKKMIKITTGDYPPWSSQNYKHGGFISHIIKESFKRAGYNVIYYYFPWARAYKEGLSGKYHASAFWFCTVKRKQDYYCNEEPLASEDIVFFHLRTTQVGEWKKLSDLAHFRIGTTRSYAYTPKLQSEEHGLTIETINSDEIGLNMLLNERIDLFALSMIVGYSILNHKFAPGTAKLVDISSKPITTDNLYLLFPKTKQDSEPLLKAFDKALKSMHKDGTYDEYYNKLLEGYYLKK
ncbi:substrate-binding periplasmic protein [Spartinivicinus poritis]|uniref:Transporter substrate-binding domain-containing protein n=1 Tax=Spartinivicinus poritis TaxID=2994640 RepID=A0ABT5UH92_9GAMM|nr:transporter substrate-binding domain-containing protein [Spartinivicinus sp. A2-2]MDE1464803.1 transporter substrate-binding domain-containing protein [Spartinivicinus sp. A2-2]